jgi:sugar phosphate isomerase/epimerase
VTALRVAVSEWTLREERLERAAARVAALGYDGFELAGRPERPAGDVHRTLAAAGLRATSVCTVWSASRDYAHPEPGPRRAAVDYLRACLAWGGDLGVGAVVVVPTYRTEPLAPRGDELARAAESIASALDGHPADGPRVAIEPLNLYETHLVRTLADAEELRAAIGHPAAGLLGDVFHMNIEERSISRALAAHAEHLVHVHLADSNRAEPGAGHIDFAAVADVLRERGYAGALAMEFVPWTDDAGGRGLAHVRAAVSGATAQGRP